MENRAVPNNQVNATELNRGESATAPLLLPRLVRDLEVLGDELWIAEETLGQPVWTYQDPLEERLRRVGVNNQKIEDFSAWTRTISSLISDDLRDENQLARIIAAEAAGLKLIAEWQLSGPRGSCSVGGYRGLELPHARRLERRLQWD
jgi:hypothetical protein